MNQDISPGKSPDLCLDMALEQLRDAALGLGAGEAGILLSDALVVENRLADYCIRPQCPGYGRSMSCPPHVGGPDWFREYLTRVLRVLVFKLDVATGILMSHERYPVIRRLHAMAASLERTAIDAGFSEARAFAAGSCMQAFCNDHDSCSVLSGSECRYPDQARQSMSGMGVNVTLLAQALGWEMKIITKDTDPESVPMGMMVGLVCLGQRR
ncbi:MAG: DUF2284 domain-containing protein [Pseudomonadota bacterium]